MIWVNYRLQSNIFMQSIIGLQTIKGLNVKHQSTLLFLAISLSFTGCAVTSGLQTYDLPEQGTFKTAQGAEVSVVQLTQNNIPKISSESLRPGKYAVLFHTPLSISLKPGDVLSIQLWAYPEITPPVQGSSSDIKAFGYPIDSTGNVQLPLVGQVHIAELLLRPIKYLRNQFAKYLKTPDVVVRVLSYQAKRYLLTVRS